MKNIILILILTVPIVAFSQKISCEETVQLYLIALEDFQTSPLILHKKDNEMLVTKPWVCQTALPSKVGDVKVKWFGFDDDLSEILEGDIKKHNGRSVILISHRQSSPDTVTVYVYQKILGNLETGRSFAPINEDIYTEYKKKNHDFLFVRNDSNWTLEAKSNDLNPITSKEQEIEEIFQKGNSLNSEGKYKEALDHVNRSMAMDSSMYQRYMFRARIKIKLGMFDSAISDVTKCIERCDCPTREFHVPSYYLERAEIHTLKGDNASALSDIEKSISLNPKAWKAYFSRAALLCQEKDFENALIDLNKAIELGANRIETYYLRGMVNIALGNDKAACSDLMVAINAGFEKPKNWVEENCK